MGRRQKPSAEEQELRKQALAAQQERMAAAARRLVPVTCPVYTEDERGLADLVGTSILLRIGPEHFLATASHVMERYNYGPLFIGNDGPVVRMPTRYITSTAPGEQASSDQFDVAVVPLGDELVAALGATKFLGVNDTASEEVTDYTAVTGSKYLLIGYPASKQPPMEGIHLSARSMKVLVTPLPLASYNVRRLNPRWHLMIEFDKKEMHGKDGQITAPDPYGMSGGGVWKLDGFFADGNESERLVAIATEYTGKSGKSIVCTRIGHVFDAVHDHFPMLRAYLPTPTP